MKVYRSPMRHLPIALFTIMAVLALGDSSALCAAAPPLVSSTELVEEADYWDGREVTFEGEAIGDVMVRGSDAWLHLNDDAYAELPIPAGARPQGYNSGHAVFLPAAEARKVTVFGSYRARGDIVRVTGTFKAADPEHGGDMHIAATTLELLEPGFPIERTVPRWKLLLLASLVPVAGASYVAFRNRASALPR